MTFPVGDRSRDGGLGQGSLANPGRPWAGPESWDLASKEMKAQAGGQRLGTHQVSKPGVRAAGETRGTGRVRSRARPAAPPHGARHVCCLFSWQAGRGSRQAERAGQGGCPSSPFLGTHSCTCTHTPRAGMRPLPALPLRTGRGSTSPLLLQASREGTLPSVGCGGLRLNWDGPRAPGPPGSLAGSHNTPRLAPLSANRTLWVGGKRGPLPASAEPRPAGRGSCAEWRRVWLQSPGPRPGGR